MNQTEKLGAHEWIKFTMRTRRTKRTRRTRRTLGEL